MTMYNKILFLSFALVSSVNASVLDELNYRYHNTVDSCDYDLYPAYYCSGVLIRATGSSEGYFPWNPSPSAVELGSVSFSFLRNDILIRELFKNNGFIFKSQAQAISEGLEINYRCSYPFEALTIGRENHGCGSYIGENQESSCYDLGIKRLYQWSNYINNEGSNIGKAQCSFNTNRIYDFILSVKAHDVGRFDLEHSILGIYGEKYNEVLIESWEQNQSVPIEAFWYIHGDDNALQNAISDKHRYLEATGNNVSIVALDLNKLENPFVSIYYE